MLGNTVLLYLAKVQDLLERAEAVNDDDLAAKFLSIADRYLDLAELLARMEISVGPSASDS